MTRDDDQLSMLQRGRCSPIVDEVDTKLMELLSTDIRDIS